ncbi:meiotically up-regulated gene protein [Pseudozyma hubeiensis SY62]|uniref:Meiotically up-regulated gene protein n=1 Tax=Pseudozyma hubeiensis (strain SY62) TaxID=1305764 RepID=R9PC52_PSEHS|nr:meiotically up-regulated gene protein [Pseudozyma hubeiensis SY62]GAC95660.1 meiotically up-regulated gene protein [Pseudozyma hubeiensis SY62]
MGPCLRYVQPPFHLLMSQQGPQLSGLQAPEPDRDTALLLDGLDTTVLTSPSMFRALTEPFGHIVDIRNGEQRHSPWCSGRALVKYCCSSSARLAQLSLHGLVVGAGRISATLAQPRSSASLGQHDSVKCPVDYTNPSSLAATPGTGPGGCNRGDSMPPPLQSHRVTPRQLDDTLPSNKSTHITAQRAFDSVSAAVVPWQTNATSGTCDDADLVDRVSFCRSAYSSDSPPSKRCSDPDRPEFLSFHLQRTLPRPIGDERRRSIRTTK